MGKRRDKTGRRQKLQLNDEKPPAPKVRNPLQKLMQYSDSEDEETKSHSNEVTSANENKQDSRQIDLEVADFLKEIDELHTNNEETDKDESNKTVSSVEEDTKKQLEKSSPVIQSTKQEADSYEISSQNLKSHEEVCSSENYENNNGGMHKSWQHCYDENSGYTYFWNMDTNEVTWECPEEYNNYFHKMDKSSTKNNKLANLAGKQSMKRALETNSQAEIPYDGKITPITYFEPHISSDDSSEEENIQMKENFRKKVKIHRINSNQSNPKNSKDTGLKIQGCAPEKCFNTLKKSPSQDNDSPIGPQLPSYYKPRESKMEEQVPNSNEIKTEILNSTAVIKDDIEIPSSNNLKVPLPSENLENDISSSRCAKHDQVCGQEPDSTTRKELTSEIKKKDGHHSGVRSMTKKVLRTLVQYAESGSEEEKDETIVYNSETYRQDGRQGFGFKECSSTINNLSKSEKEVERDYPMISFIKSNEILDLKKLNQQKSDNMKINHQCVETSNITTKHKLCNSGLIEISSKQQTNENLELSKRNENMSFINSGDLEISNKPENLKHIQDLSSVMLDKLSFLTVGQAEISSLHQLLLQLQTRYIDWKENALNSSYFLNKLQEVQDFLRQYEMNAMPSGWICDWDRQHKRYFYVNERSGHTQWDYPQIVAAQMHTEAISECSVSSGLVISEGKSVQLPQHSLVSSSVSEALLTQIATVPSLYSSNTGYQPETTWSSRLTSDKSESPPPSPPGVDKPLPPLPPPNSPPPPPPDSTELEDGEIADVEMEIDSDDLCDELSISTSSLQTSNDIKTELQTFPYQSSPSSSVSVVSCNVTDNIVISKTPNNSTISSTEDKLIQYCSAGCAVYPNSSVCQSTVEKIHDSTPPNNAEVTNIAAVPPKKERKKCKLSSGLTLKKKNIPSLVQKWQKIKEQQDKDSENSGVPI